MTKTITISEGITLTATQSTIDAYEAECKAIEAERAAMEYLLHGDPTDEVYSDIYKDVYGVRPRW